MSVPVEHVLHISSHWLRGGKRGKGRSLDINSNIQLTRPGTTSGEVQMRLPAHERLDDVRLIAEQDVYGTAVSNAEVSHFLSINIPNFRDIAHRGAVVFPYITPWDNQANESKAALTTG